MTRDERRINRKRVLQALQSETGSSGGDVAEQRVKDFIEDPVDAPTEEFAYVGALTLRRFYIDPTKPNTSERRSLWQELLKRFDNGSAMDPGGWASDTNVAQLQAIVEQALALA